MAFATSETTGWTPEQTTTQLPAGDSLPSQITTAATAPGLGQAVYFDASGNVAGNDGTVPNQLCAGVAYPEKRAPISPVATSGSVQVHQGLGGGVPSSPAAGDGFAAGDRQVIVYDAGNGIAGRLSNRAGNDRSIMGLGRGLRGDGTIRVWAGPEGSLMARALMMADQGHTAGAISYPADVSASTDIGSLTVSTSSLIMVRARLRGLITAIEIIPSATQVITSGNDRTITFWKIDTLGVNADVKIATFASTTAMAAPNAANCLTAHLVSLATLLGGLVMRETDIIGYSTVHVASGVAFPQMIIRILMRAI